MCDGLIGVVHFAGGLPRRNPKNDARDVLTEGRRWRWLVVLGMTGQSVLEGRDGADVGRSAKLGQDHPSEHYLRTSLVALRACTGHCRPVAGDTLPGGWKAQTTIMTHVGRADAGALFACGAQTGEFQEDQIPTVGFNMRKVTKGNVSIKMWDIGGQPRFRTMWERYCRGVTAIVYARCYCC